MKCNHCGYDWEYSGELDTATCPNCSRKTSATETETEQ